MALAVDAGGVGTEGRAWARVQLGLLRFGGGDLAGAEREMRAALAERPGDARATAGLARVTAARGDLAGAAELYSQAIDSVPLPEYPAALAEVDEALGRADAAREDVALVGAMQRLLAANGSDVDLDTALIRADTRIPGAADIRLARRAHAVAARRDRRPGARLGAHPRRPLRRGRPLRHPQPAARHPRRADALPGRHGGLVQRPPGRRTAAPRGRARPEPGVLGALGPGGPPRAGEGLA